MDREKYLRINNMFKEGLKKDEIIVVTREGSYVTGEKLYVIKLITLLLDSLLSDNSIESKDIDLIIGLLDNYKKEDK